MTLNLIPTSVVTIKEATFGLAQIAGSHKLAVLAEPGSHLFATFEGETSEYQGRTLLLGPLSPRNAAALRQNLPWLRPQPLGLRTSVGLGDRLGLATPGHVRAVRAAGGNIAPIFAQQSIREMARTGRTPQQVLDDATWGLFAEGWRQPWGADADHLKTTADIDACLAAGFTFFTIDPSDHLTPVDISSPTSELRGIAQTLPWEELEDTMDSMVSRYLYRPLYIEDQEITFPYLLLLVTIATYGRALVHVVRMYRHLLQAAGDRPVEVEISIDETESLTTPMGHAFIAAELQRLGVRWVSLAPHYIGWFEKAVDYKGKVELFERELTSHAAIARHFGPYKLGVHSGSDKFSLYPIIAAQTRGLVHLKTAGTSYLEALRTVAALDPALFREIYAFARERYPTDRAGYLVSAKVDHTPRPEDLSDAELPSLLEQPEARQVLHVTFGSVLTAQDAAGNPLFAPRLLSLLRAHSQAYAANLEAHLLRHLQPFAAVASGASGDA